MGSRKVSDIGKMVGENISKKRKMLGLTQTKLAEQLDIRPDALSRIENGSVSPKIQRLPDIASALECSVADLFREENAPVEAKLNSIAGMLRQMSPEMQDDLICIMANTIQLMKKHL